MYHCLQNLLAENTRRTLDDIFTLFNQKDLSDKSLGFQAQSSCSRSGLTSPINYLRERISSPFPSRHCTCCQKSVCHSESKENEPTLSSIVSLYSWSPVDIQPDGDCCIAGLLNCDHLGKRCEFHITYRVTDLTDSYIITEDQSKYKLHGSICWSTYCAVNPKLSTFTLPPDLIKAFADGFPKTKWRWWLQGMQYFISSKMDSLSTSTPRIAALKSVSSAEPVVNETKKVNYSRLANTSKRADVDAYLNLFSKDIVENLNESDELTVSSSNSFESHFTSLSSAPILKSKELLGMNHQGLSPRYKTVGKYKSKRNSLVHHLKNTKERSNHKIRTMTSPISKIDKRFRLYRDNGEIIDARNLPRSRSGRLILPKLDSRYAQSIILDDEDEIVRVSHEA